MFKKVKISYNIKLFFRSFIEKDSDKLYASNVVNLSDEEYENNYSRGKNIEAKKKRPEPKGYCEECKKKVNVVQNFYCKYCRKYFCEEHRISEDHNCNGELKNPHRPQETVESLRFHRG